MRVIRILGAAVVLLAAAMPIRAQSPGSAAAVSLRLSTLGGGVEVATPVLPKLNLRAGIHGASYSYDTDYSDNDYEFEWVYSSEIGYSNNCIWDKEDFTLVMLRGEDHHTGDRMAVLDNSKRVKLDE